MANPLASLAREPVGRNTTSLAHWLARSPVRWLYSADSGGGMWPDKGCCAGLLSEDAPLERLGGGSHTPGPGPHEQPVLGSLRSRGTRCVPGRESCYVTNGKIKETSFFR